VTEAPGRPAAPGARLLALPPPVAALLVVFDDVWLKRRHPGLVSGKLADLGLCFFAPVVAATLVEWAAWTRARLRGAPFATPGARLDAVACGVVAVYFTALKLSPLAARAHVAVLSALVPGVRFGAVADATDLVALPLVVAAFAYLRSCAGPPRDTR